MTFYPGQSVTITCTVKNAGGANATPSALQITVRDPLGVDTVTTIGSLSNPSTGVYSHTVALTLSGTYTYRWEAESGVDLGADEGFIKVAETLQP